MSYNVRTLSDSIKFYLPRTEGYLEIIRHIAEQYGAMSLIEFDGYFEGKFEPTKYMRVEVHVNDAKEDGLIEFANKIRIMLKQKSLAFEFNNRLILVEETYVLLQVLYLSIASSSNLLIPFQCDPGPSRIIVWSII